MISNGDPIPTDSLTGPLPIPVQGELFKVETAHRRTSEELDALAHAIGEVATSGVPSTSNDGATQSHQIALEDGSGTSPFVARLATGQEQPPFTGAQNPPRPSRRTGRRHHVPTYLQDKYAHTPQTGDGLLSEEQATVAQKAVDEVRPELEAVARSATLQTAGGNKSLAAAIRVARLVERGRRW